MCAYQRRAILIVAIIAIIAAGAVLLLTNWDGGLSCAEQMERGIGDLCDDLSAPVFPTP